MPAKAIRIATGQAIAMACSMGNLELNAFLPLVADSLLGSLSLLENACRILRCRKAGVPITNYGLTIAYSLGIFERALSPFPAALDVYRQLRKDAPGG